MLLCRSAGKRRLRTSDREKPVRVYLRLLLSSFSPNRCPPVPTTTAGPRVCRVGPTAPLHRSGLVRGRAILPRIDIGNRRRGSTPGTDTGIDAGIDIVDRRDDASFRRMSLSQNAVSQTGRRFGTSLAILQHKIRSGAGWHIAFFRPASSSPPTGVIHLQVPHAVAVFFFLEAMGNWTWRLPHGSSSSAAALMA
jgi:hypothetical protein